LDVGREMEIGIGKVGTNSAVLYGPDGQAVGGYWKMNLLRLSESRYVPQFTGSTFLTTPNTIYLAGTGFMTLHLPRSPCTITITHPSTPTQNPSDSYP
jgi:hypothetical protein